VSLYQHEQYFGQIKQDITNMAQKEFGGGVQDNKKRTQIVISNN